MAHQTSIDQARPMKVICIGAGVAGILTGVRFPQKLKNLDLTIYEKNAGIGGTWFENRYPGIACDIPSQSYSFTFEPFSEWDNFYSSGQQILSYLNHVVDKYGVRKYVKLSHEFKSARWNDAENQWHVEILRHEDNTVLIDTADVLVKGTGILNKWKWPNIEGLHNYQGSLLHSAAWDPAVNLQRKRVAVIGNGSTGIQIVPALQPIAEHVRVYMRSRSWVSPVGAFQDEIVKRGGNENFSYSEQEKAEYRKQPSTLSDSRRDLEEIINKGYLNIMRDSPSRASSTARLQELVQQKLQGKPGLFEAIRPEWPVGCKRLGASPGYLEALTQPNVDIVSIGVEKILPSGIKHKDGSVSKVDAIICATGFDTTLNLEATPIVGQDGTSLGKLWSDRGPTAYLSIMPEACPNLFLYLGPNGTPMASMIPMIEFQCAYMIKCIQKLQRERYAAMVPKVAAIRDFVSHADSFFAKTVLTENCGTWFKSGENGRVAALWPGGLPHAWLALQEPRWEDFDYIPKEGASNRFTWLGDGTTEALKIGAKTTSYLDEVDIPPINPTWRLKQS